MRKLLLTLLILCCLTIPSHAFKFASGAVDGTGGTITVHLIPAFQPTLVILRLNAATSLTVFKTDTMSANNSFYLGNCSAALTTCIASITSDGFTIGALSNCNVTGTANILYEAFAPDANNDFTTGSYTTTGSPSDNRDIVISPAFQPDLVVVRMAGAQCGVWHGSSLAGDNTSKFESSANLADAIQAFNSNGFQVGLAAQVQTASNTFHYFAFRNRPQCFAVGTFTGDANDNRNITGVGFLPVFGWIKANAAVSASSRFTSLAGDLSFASQTTGTAAANFIQSFTFDTFQVGASAGNQANDPTVAMYWAMWGDHCRRRLS